MKKTLRYFEAKINAITGSPEKELGEFLLKEFKPIITGIKNSDPSISTHLKNYFVIHLVTIIENHFKETLSFVVDNHKIDVFQLLDKNEISIPITKLDELQKIKITKGKIVASNFNFQNISEINHVFSTIFGINFLTNIKKLAKKHLITRLLDDKHPYKKEIEKKENYFIEFWADFLKIFSLRNSLVHSTKTNVTWDAEKLWHMYESILTFLVTADFFIDMQLMWIKDKKELVKEARSGKLNNSNLKYPLKYEDYIPQLKEFMHK